MTTRQKSSQPATVKHYGHDVTVEAVVGSVVKLDDARIAEKLLEGDDYVDSGFEGCDFRYPNPVAGWEKSHAIACNVHVTGRTVQRRHDADWVRVKVEWVGDCEPSTFSAGWMLVS